MNSNNGCLGFFFLCLLISLQISCARTEAVLVVGDPYIETIYEREWYGGKKSFLLRIRLRGYRADYVLADRENTLADILGNLESPADIVVLSPWNADSIADLPPSNTKFIIAGGLYDSISEHEVVSLIPNRNQVIEHFGSISSRISSESKKPAIAIFDAASEDQLREIDALVGAFINDGELIVKNINEEEYWDLPSRFDELFREASVLLLFSGPVNYQALVASENQLLPVFTESLGASEAWEYRIVASVEENFRALSKAIIKALKTEDQNEVVYYPARLQKGELYEQFSR